MADATLAFRASQIALIRSDAPMVSLIGQRVYDAIPQEEVFPYVRVGDDLVLDFGAKLSPGQEFDFSFHIFDRSSPDRGQFRVNQISARLYDLYHEQPIAVSGFNPYLSRFRQSRVASDDGMTWHGISTFRLLL